MFLIGDADYFGNHSFIAIPLAGTTPPTSLMPLPISGTCGSLVSIGNSNNYFFTLHSMMFPIDIWMFTANLTSGSPQFPILPPVQMTNENSDILGNIDFSPPQRYRFTGSNGDTVYGWVLRPFGTAQSVPVANLIHGGPQEGWKDSWSYRWNPQLFCSHGYGVLMIDFHGSTGYGQSFTDSISGNWGSLPYWDIMNGTFAALGQFPYLDKSRVGACGASFGGYMVNWIHGQTNFFKALVTHDGIFDTFSAYYSTEELWFPEWEFKGIPWDSPALYDKWNPAEYAQNWQVPHLIIHGGRDYRLTLSQGLGAFTALQRQGIPSAFLEFDMENHWVLRDENGIKWYQTVLGWLDTYVNSSSAFATPKIVINKK